MAQIANIAVIAAKAMRVLTACDTPATLLPAVQNLFDDMELWYRELPAVAKSTELSHTPWDESKVCLGYVHLGHLGAITLILRRTLSIYRPTLGRQKQVIYPAERAKVSAVLNDGIIAAKQSSRILYLFLGEQAGIRHCWAVMYISPRSCGPHSISKTRLTSSRYIAFVSAAILLYSVSQMQLHDYPETEWQPYLTLVHNDMDVLAYCQELDPVAGTLRDTISQYMQFLQIPSRAPENPTAPAWSRAALNPPSEMPRENPQGQDLIDLLLTMPKGRAGPAQTSLDLLKIVCQPFSHVAEQSRRAPDNDNPPAKPGYGIPYVLGDVSGRSACGISSEPRSDDAWMPFGWTECQTNAGFTNKSTNLALTMAQQEMLRAGV